MNCKVVFLLALVAAVCAKDLAPLCPCGKIYIPVCASNGITYNNMCEFHCGEKQHIQKFGNTLTVMWQGRCDGKD